jgi:hypothetical protein
VPEGFRAGFHGSGWVGGYKLHHMVLYSVDGISAMASFFYTAHTCHISISPCHLQSNVLSLVYSDATGEAG